MRIHSDDTERMQVKLCFGRIYLASQDMYWSGAHRTKTPLASGRFALHLRTCHGRFSSREVAGTGYIRLPDRNSIQLTPRVPRDAARQWCLLHSFAMCCFSLWLCIWILAGGNQVHKIPGCQRVSLSRDPLLSFMLMYQLSRCMKMFYDVLICFMSVICLYTLQSIRSLQGGCTWEPGQLLARGSHWEHSACQRQGWMKTQDGEILWNCE